jgi:hypothetical protein
MVQYQEISLHKSRVWQDSSGKYHIFSATVKIKTIVPLKAEFVYIPPNDQQNLVQFSIPHHSTYQWTYKILSSQENSCFLSNPAQQEHLMIQ